MGGELERPRKEGSRDYLKKEAVVGRQRAYLRLCICFQCPLSFIATPIVSMSLRKSATVMLDRSVAKRDGA